MSDIVARARLSVAPYGILSGNNSSSGGAIPRIADRRSGRRPFRRVMVVMRNSPLSARELSLADAGRPTASDGLQPFGGRGSAAVTGQERPIKGSARSTRNQPFADS